MGHLSAAFRSARFKTTMFDVTAYDNAESKTTELFDPHSLNTSVFCKETAGMDDWDAPCSDYLCCTFGCAVYGGDRSVCESIAPALRRNWLTETIADLMSSGMSQEQRCEMQKCNAYCARRAFDTCRETMFRQACEASNPHLYGCDVECSSADGKRPMAIASFVGLWWLAGRI